MKPHIKKPLRQTSSENGRQMVVTTKKNGFLFVNLISEEDPGAKGKLEMLKHYQDKPALEHGTGEQQTQSRVRKGFPSQTQTRLGIPAKRPEHRKASPGCSLCPQDYRHSQERPHVLNASSSCLEEIRAAGTRQKHFDPTGISGRLRSIEPGHTTQSEGLDLSLSLKTEVDQNVTDLPRSASSQTHTASCQASVIEHDGGFRSAQESAEFPVILNNFGEKTALRAASIHHQHVSEVIKSSSTQTSGSSRHWGSPTIQSIYMSSKSPSRILDRDSSHPKPLRDLQLESGYATSRSEFREFHIRRAHESSTPGNLSAAYSAQEQSSGVDDEQGKGHSMVSHGGPNTDVTIDCWRHRRKLLGMGSNVSTCARNLPEELGHRAGDGTVGKESPDTDRPVRCASEQSSNTFGVWSTVSQTRASPSAPPPFSTSAIKGRAGEVDRYLDAWYTDSDLSEGYEESDGINDDSLAENARRLINDTQQVSRADGLMTEAFPLHRKLHITCMNGNNVILNSEIERGPGSLTKVMPTRAQQSPTMLSSDASSTGRDFQPSRASPAGIGGGSTIQVGGVWIVPPHSEHQRRSSNLSERDQHCRTGKAGSTCVVHTPHISELSATGCSQVANERRTDTTSLGAPKGFIYDSVLDCFYNPASGEFVRRA